MYMAVKLLFLALLMLQVALLVTSKICSYAYHSTKTNECEVCGRCGLGEGVEKNCGHDENGDMIPGKSRCRKCSKDEYQMKVNSTTMCGRCNKCHGRRFKIACSATADAVCEDCPKGFYEHNNKCYKCTRCCDGSKEGKRIKECLNDGMGKSHSCSQDSTCLESPAPTQNIPTTINITKTPNQSKPSPPNTIVLNSTSSETIVFSTSSSTKQDSPLVSQTRTATQKNNSSGTPSRQRTQYTHSASEAYNARRSQSTTDGEVQKEATATLPSRIITSIKEYSHPRTQYQKDKEGKGDVKPFLLVVALVGVLIIIVLVLMCAKSRKGRRDLPKGAARHSKQPEEVRISLSSAKEEEEEEEKVVEGNGSEHYPADSKGYKAVPYESNGNHSYVIVEEEHFLDGTKVHANQVSRDVKKGEGSRRSSSSRLSGSSSDELDDTLGVLKECQKTTIKQSMDPCKDGITSWKEVATYFRVPQETIETWNAKIKSGDSPTESLLYYLNTQKVTISLLLECLKKLERFDVHDSLLRHLKSKCNICR